MQARMAREELGKGGSVKMSTVAKLEKDNQEQPLGPTPLLQLNGGGTPSNPLSWRGRFGVARG